MNSITNITIYLHPKYQILSEEIKKFIEEIFGKMKRIDVVSDYTKDMVDKIDVCFKFDKEFSQTILYDKCSLLQSKIREKFNPPEVNIHSTFGDAKTGTYTLTLRNTPNPKFSELLKDFEIQNFDLKDFDIITKDIIEFIQVEIPTKVYLNKKTVNGIIPEIKTYLEMMISDQNKKISFVKDFYFEISDSYEPVIDLKIKTKLKIDAILEQTIVLNISRFFEKLLERTYPISISMNEDDEF
jgi:hypothetical protein